MRPRSQVIFHLAASIENKLIERKEASRSAAIMLAHQIKSDCGRRRPAVDGTADGRREEKSMSPDERRPNDGQQSCSSPPASHESTGTQYCDTTRSSCGSGDIKRRQQVAQSDKINRTIGTSMRPVEARLLVRRREAGALIGKRGANIKRLRQIFKESAFNIPDTGNGPERIVCINTCSFDQLSMILIELTQLFQEKQQNQPARIYPPTLSPDPTASRASELIEVKLLVNASHAGLLIGVGGQSIRKLRSDSKAAIKIYEMCCPLSSERVCAIKAKPPVVVSTIKMILEILATNPIKGTHKPYDALNFDLFLVDKYGGYGADDETSSISSGPTTAPATSPLDFLQQLHQVNPQTSPAHSALLLQNQAAQLLAAAAAAATAAASGRAGTAADYLDLQRLRSSPSHMARMFARAPPSCDRFTAAAALAAEKYHSIMKAGQQAAIAGRYHPYQVHVPLRGHHLPSGGDRHQAALDQHHSSFRSSSLHGLACSYCEPKSEVQANSSPPTSPGDELGTAKGPPA